ncbi:MAG: hypothetical protein Q9214_005286 [Letrouitia sp. 1 TL-2023]
MRASKEKTEEDRLASEREAREENLRKQTERFEKEQELEKQRVQEARKAEEQRFAEEAAKKEREVEEKRIANEKATEERLAEEKRVAEEKRLSEKKLAEEKRLAQEEADKERVEEERQAQARKEEEMRATEKKARGQEEKKRRAAERKAQRLKGQQQNKEATELRAQQLRQLEEEEKRVAEQEAQQLKKQEEERKKKEEEWKRKEEENRKRTEEEARKLREKAKAEREKKAAERKAEEQRQATMAEHSKTNSLSQDQRPHRQDKQAEVEGTLAHKHHVLEGRSPKARLNATRQLILANNALKRDQIRSSKLDQPNASGHTSNETNHAGVLERHKKEKVRRRLDRKSVGAKQIQNASSQEVMIRDMDALKAAGLYNMKEVTPAAKKRKTTNPSRPAKTRSSISSVPFGPQPKSSPSINVSSDVEQARTMTPAIPGKSLYHTPSHNGSSSSLRRSQSLSTLAVKSPLRSALRVTPRESNRSVSFVDTRKMKSALLAQNPSSSRKPSETRQAGKPSENKKHSDFSEPPQQSVSTKSSSKPETPSSEFSSKKRQMDMKRFVQNQPIDKKMKGKVIDPPSSALKPNSKSEPGAIEISSDESVSTWYSDEEEGRPPDSKAGPSLRKKLKPKNKDIKADLNDEESEILLPKADDTAKAQTALQGENGARDESSRSRSPAVYRAHHGSSKSSSQSGSALQSRSRTDSGPGSESGSRSSLSSRQKIIPAGLDSPDLSSSPAATVSTNSAAKPNGENIDEDEASQQLQREHSLSLQTQSSSQFQPFSQPSSKKTPAPVYAKSSSPSSAAANSPYPTLSSLRQQQASLSNIGASQRARVVEPEYTSSEGDSEESESSIDDNDDKVEETKEDRSALKGLKSLLFRKGSQRKRH